MQERLATIASSAAWRQIGEPIENVGLHRVRVAAEASKPARVSLKDDRLLVEERESGGARAGSARATRKAKALSPAPISAMVAGPSGSMLRRASATIEALVMSALTRSRSRRERIARGSAGGRTSSHSASTRRVISMASSSRHAQQRAVAAEARAEGGHPPRSRRNAALERRLQHEQHEGAAQVAVFAQSESRTSSSAARGCRAGPRALRPPACNTQAPIARARVLARQTSPNLARMIRGQPGTGSVRCCASAAARSKRARRAATGCERAAPIHSDRGRPRGRTTVPRASAARGGRAASAEIVVEVEGGAADLDADGDHCLATLCSDEGFRGAQVRSAAPHPWPTRSGAAHRAQLERPGDIAGEAGAQVTRAGADDDGVRRGAIPARRRRCRRPARRAGAS